MIENPLIPQWRRFAETTIEGVMIDHPKATGAELRNLVRNPWPATSESGKVFDGVLRDKCTERDAELAAVKAQARAEEATGRLFE